MSARRRQAKPGPFARGIGPRGMRSNTGVSATKLGEMQCTRTPCRDTSSDRLRTKAMIPPNAAPMTDWRGEANLPASDAKPMIVPPRTARCGKAAKHSRWKLPRTSAAWSPKLAGVGLGERPRDARCPGDPAMDDSVEPPRASAHFGDHRLDRALFAKVRRGSDQLGTGHARAQPLHRLGDALRTGTMHRNDGTGFGGLRGDLEPDGPAGAGHQHDIAAR